MSSRHVYILLVPWGGSGSRSFLCGLVRCRERSLWSVFKLNHTLKVLLKWSQNVKALVYRSEYKVILYFYNFSHFLLWLFSLYFIWATVSALLTCLGPIRHFYFSFGTHILSVYIVFSYMNVVTTAVEWVQTGLGTKHYRPISIGLHQGDR